MWVALLVRILIDTNIWRYVLDAGASGALLRAAEDSNHQLQIAPSALYETLRMSNIAVRDRLVHLITDRHITRLMPEAYSESEEIFGQISEHRATWMRIPPDQKKFDRLKKDWSRKAGGFWTRCRKSPASEVRALLGLGDDATLAAARDEAQNARKEAYDARLREHEKLNAVFVSFTQKLPGWRGEPVDHWRVSGWSATTWALQQPRHAYKDWLEPRVDLSALRADDVSWLTLWLYEVAAADMPRFWLRWAIEYCQRFRKVTPGTPCDSQLGTYALDTDLILSSDTAFIQILDRCRRYAPQPLAEARCVRPEAQLMRCCSRFNNLSPCVRKPTSNPN